MGACEEADMVGVGGGVQAEVSIKGQFVKKSHARLGPLETGKPAALVGHIVLIKS